MDVSVAGQEEQNCQLIDRFDQIERSATVVSKSVEASE